MEDILDSIRRVIADDQKAATVVREDLPVQDIASHSHETSIEDDVLALRNALNAIRGEMDGIQKSASFASEAGETKEEPELPEVLSESVEDEGLLSPQAEGAVRRSFTELTEATVEASRQFDMESAAHALLRPMLRQWLDENLPELVERLVKEEIARLARP